MDKEFTTCFESITYDTWIHVAMVYEGQYNGAKAFMDGNQVGYCEQKYQEFPEIPSKNLMIGRLLARQNTMQAKYTNVEVDELLIWNRKLDEDEIAMVMQMADNYG